MNAVLLVGQYADTPTVLVVRGMGRIETHRAPDDSVVEIARWLARVLIDHKEINSLAIETVDIGHAVYDYISNLRRDGMFPFTRFRTIGRREM